MKLVYDVKDRPKFKANLVFALQQLLAIIAATLLVPTLVNLNYGQEVLNQAAALLGAGVGTLTYILFTQRKSPVFLGSSFAFISPLVGAAAFGAFGIILGAVIAGLVYVIIALVVRFVGTKWVEKLLPPVVIGPTVA
ncbi:MAG: solute carrier family 23 protein, partial [Eubacteriales bacterium]|nr:solute carrier family 23 protein [Eubacteriales bacterium]